MRRARRSILALMACVRTRPGGVPISRWAWRSVLVGLACVGGVLPAQAQGGRVPLPVITVDPGTTCVAPREEIRRTHARLLNDLKHVTVQQGVRGDVSLRGCIDCHARPSGAVIGTRDAFCQSCHDFVGVKLNCFDCHQARPAAAAAAKPGAGRP